MLKAKVNEAVNKQINDEMSSAYLYLSMSAYFERIERPGMAKWMYAQYQEELDHTLRFFNYVHERGGTVTLEAIAKPIDSWESPLDAFEYTLKHEENITEIVNGFVDVTISERDHATSNFLQWFVAEQVEEVSTVRTIISQLKMLNNSNEGMYMLDKELGLRVFTPAP